MKSKLITKKLEELIALAKVEDEPNVQIIIYALLGAREAKDDGLLASLVQTIITEVLMPNADAKLIAKKIAEN